MFCQKCGSKIEDNARFCAKCGTPAPVRAQQPAQQPNRAAAQQPQGYQPPRQQAPQGYQQPVYGKPASGPQPPYASGRQGAAPAAAAKKSGGCGRILIIAVAVVVVIGILGIIGGRSGGSSYVDEGSGGTGSVYGQVSGTVDMTSSQSGTAGDSTGTSGTSGNSGGAAPAGNSDETWTVMLYFCGTDLESGAGLATDNLVELQEARLGSNVNFLVETGGCSRWRNNLIDEDHIMRFHLQDGYYNEEASLPLASMGDPSTLADYVSWGVQEYPADHYALIFWDHGGGSLLGVCFDENFGDDMLSLPEIGSALETAGAHLDVVGFDTCLMGTLELAQVLSPHADYMVGSEELVPGGGWDYTAFSEWLTQNSGAGSEAFGQAICDSYFAKCRRWRQQDTATLSVIDLSKVPALTSAFTGVAGDMVLATTDTATFRTLSAGAKSTEYYGGDVSYDMVDLGDLVQNTSGILSEENRNAVLQALDDAVVYEVHGSNRQGAHGLSVFYPLYIDDYVYRDYESIAQVETYLQLAAIMNGDYSAYDWSPTTPLEEEEEEPLTEDDYEIDFYTEVVDDFYAYMYVTEGLDSIVQVDFELALLLGDNVDDLSIVYLGSDVDVSADFQNGVFRDNFVGRWVGIDGHYVMAELMEERSDYALYMIPVRLNGEDAMLWASYDYAADAYTVLGVYDNYTLEDGPAGKTGRALEAGDEVTFLFASQGMDDEEMELIELDTITWSDSTTMDEMELGDGTFAYMFRIVDIFGNELTSDPIIMEVSGDGQYLQVMTMEDWLYGMM